VLRERELEGEVGMGKVKERGAKGEENKEGEIRCKSREGKR